MDELASAMPGQERQLGQLKSGAVILVWSVPLKVAKGKTDPVPDKNAPVAKMVLGYVKDVPSKGGLVLMGDGTVTEMSADDFKKATLAKPEK